MMIKLVLFMNNRNQFSIILAKNPNFKYRHFERNLLDEFSDYVDDTFRSELSFNFSYSPDPNQTNFSSSSESGSIK